MISVAPFNSANLPLGSRFKFKLYDGRNWPPLLPGALHVWSIALDQPPEELQEVKELSRDEKERADNFRFAQHRNRFLAARHALRTILGNYVQQAPGDLEFAYPEAGKPELIFPIQSGVCFNLSHSGDVALLAVAKNQTGVDVEHLRPIPEHAQIAKCFFTERENEELQALPQKDRTMGFYRIWTRKEALLKGWGCGITKNLKEFEVSAGLEGDLLRKCRPDLKGNWKILHLEPAEEFVGAVAINSEDSQPQCFHFSNRLRVVAD